VYRDPRGDRIARAAREEATVPWQLWVLAAYLAMSLVTFVAYWMDKRAAARGSWRTPEKRLHVLSLLGGFPGALVAQRVLRHKNRKLRFHWVTWATLVLHALCGLALALRVWERAG